MTGRRFLERVEVENVKTNERRVIEACAVFSMIGAEPGTSWLPSEIERDEKDFIKTGTAIADRPAWQQMNRLPTLLETSSPECLLLAISDLDPANDAERPSVRAARRSKESTRRWGRIPDHRRSADVAGRRSSDPFLGLWKILQDGSQLRPVLERFDSPPDLAEFRCRTQFDLHSLQLAFTRITRVPKKSK